MMIYAEVAVTIRRPRHDVAAVMFDPRYEVGWIGGMMASTSTPPGPLRRGAMIVRELHRFGRRMTEQREVTDYVPERRVETLSRGPWHVHIGYELEGIPEGTIARIIVEGRPPGWARFLAPVIDLMLRRAVIRDLDRL